MAYVVEKAGRHYAVIYEGINPVTGREWRLLAPLPDPGDRREARRQNRRAAGQSS